MASIGKVMKSKTVRVFESDYEMLKSGVKHLNKICITKQWFANCIHHVITENRRLKSRIRYLESKGYV